MTFQPAFDIEMSVYLYLRCPRTNIACHMLTWGQLKFLCLSGVRMGGALLFVLSGILFGSQRCDCSHLPSFCCQDVFIWLLDLSVWKFAKVSNGRSSLSGLWHLKGRVAAADLRAFSRQARSDPFIAICSERLL